MCGQVGGSSEHLWWDTCSSSHVHPLHGGASQPGTSWRARPQPGPPSGSVPRLHACEGARESPRGRTRQSRGNTQGTGCQGLTAAAAPSRDQDNECLRESSEAERLGQTKATGDPQRTLTGHQGWGSAIPTEHKSSPRAGSQTGITLACAPEHQLCSRIWG